MNKHGKSDKRVVPTKSPNKGGERDSSPAEGAEGRRLAKGNLHQRTMFRTLGRVRMSPRLRQVRDSARRDRKMRFTALLHHVYRVDALREAYFRLKRSAAPGVDGVTWQQYGEELEANLQGLSERLKRGAYRARPVRRKFIPKADGQQRALGIATLEDKVVQGSLVEVLNAVYEVDFLGFSYGSRPGRGPHDALDALSVSVEKSKVNWVLDADIRGYFDAMDHEWLMKFVEHRIGDQRVLRLIRKWLKAGTLEGGEWQCSERGSPQGASVSPLLANIYLHYVFDLWAHRWRSTGCCGDVRIVRYVDDIVVGFQNRHEADRFLSDLRERFAQFGLELHPKEDATAGVRAFRV